ncbi:quinone-dependent dihydroorotate dehydrogenase [Haloferula rosea]|uniref:Dihydroorotate dehydrogenase (quinone) n=1 Tax=Haloferula rosea TaxID=490093 RepID=A0A934RA46_9BACT|nr:quinone-dependent dihydroorotate dehydrogenase [Haloferula rosea]MBK1826003.1 quinone-dependent dihydroorotate dehydrogenase [Haloferula rosea]
MSDAYALARSILFRLNAETAHHASMTGLRLAEKTGLLPLVFPDPECVAPVEIMGLRFPNRVGLAAGLDKEGNTIDALGRLGFGFIEIGTITPRPQAGNPKPRLFRLIDREAIINRMGFNNPGIIEGVRNVSRSTRYEGVIGFNIGKNKDTPNERAEYDYLTNLAEAYPVADYVAVNLSSPNTPGLRDLQSEDACARLLEKLKAEQEKLQTRHGRHVPLLFKVAPDLDHEHISALSRVFLDGGLDGLIATNTTITRNGVEGHPFADQAGGLSGKPLTKRSTEIIRAFSSELGGRIPIIGAGGISSADDAVEKIHAGASLVQVYSAFIFQGPALIHSIADRLDELPA